MVPLGAGGKNLAAPTEVVEFKRKRRGSLAQIPKSVLALEAASQGGKVALVWISKHHMDYDAGAAVGDISTLKFSKPVVLARDLPEDMPANHAQIRAALSDSGEGVVMVRGPDTKCPQSGASSRCASFISGRLDGSRFRSRMPLVVPSPCERPLTQGVFYAQSWYYGVCSTESGTARTTIYSINFEPEYAAAKSFESGTEGLDLVRAAGGVVALDARQGEHAAHRFGKEEKDEVTWPATSRGVFCNGETPVMHLSRSGKADERTLVKKPLAGPESAIAPWLPDALRKKPHVRAVWTGSALLIADMAAGEIRLARHQCREGVFKRTDI